MSVTLRNGKVTMPLFGLGTWQSGPEVVGAAVTRALDVGYTLIDTAAMYENEEAIGKALKGRPRDSYQLVTKLSFNHATAEEELRKSLKLLDLPYVDLYLVHTPNNKLVVETWKNMLKFRDMGLCKAVGVSNFGIQHIEELEKLGLELPEVNQIECHVWNQQPELVAYLKKKNIAIMAYCPLARGEKWGTLGGTVEEESYWAMRWCMQKDLITIPKSVDMERIKGNFERTKVALSDEKMAELDTKDIKFPALHLVHHQDLPWDEVK